MKMEKTDTENKKIKVKRTKKFKWVNLITTRNNFIEKRKNKLKKDKKDESVSERCKNFLR